MPGMKIGEVAAAAGVSDKTIRFYEDAGLLPEAPRSSNRYRVYDAAALARLRFIRAAQAVGLTLGEIREVLAFRDQGEPPCAHVLALIDRHAIELSAQIASMERLRRELVNLARKGRRLDPAECSPDAVCHIIR